MDELKKPYAWPFVVFLSFLLAIAIGMILPKLI